MEKNSAYIPRVERDEYRSRSGVQNSKKDAGKKKSDSFFRLTFLQAVLCIAVIGIVAIVGKVSPEAKEKIQKDYSQMMSSNMSVAQVIEQIGDVFALVFKPLPSQNGNVVDVFAPLPGAVAETATQVQETFESFEDKSVETGEKVALAEIVYDGTGGIDLEKGEAVKGTSFAPYTVSTEVCIPVENARITSPFGYRVNPVSGNYGFHTGLDLAVEEGTPVSAAFYGTVSECGESDVWGKYVLIEHSDNCETYYCHLSEIYVTEGAVIRQGETIGLVGSTGWSTGPHLHFEVRVDGVRVDPKPLLYPEKAYEG